jgi:hypothetical protein
MPDIIRLNRGPAVERLGTTLTIVSDGRHVAEDASATLVLGFGDPQGREVMGEEIQLCGVRVRPLARLPIPDGPVALTDGNTVIGCVLGPQTFAVPYEFDLGDPLHRLVCEKIATVWAEHLLDTDAPAPDATAMGEQLRMGWNAAHRSQVEALLGPARSNPVPDLENQIADIARQARTNNTNLARFRRELADLDALDQQAPDREAAELERIRRIPSVKKIWVQTGMIWVETDELVATHERTGRKFKIGAYRIGVGGNGWVWRNITRRVSTDHHPHIKDGDRVCLGSLSESLPGLVQSGELAMAIQLMIQFVRTANHDDAWGRSLDFWPLVEDQPACQDPALPKA